ncbi:hypothetical protein FDH86_gp022 [Arthrobacter phage Tank]|uniref:Uncharacterized protein n=1 Tax=Arthrobacter phage Tank TaxID=1772319 RepID=A0A0U4B735_9CAUD|nr:hypothetical protein FDH86_gp022 [Arthrobacter phage Tank]ALY10557.1 hypothetical protein TANK_22 [Arthrobacter phage Tank]
MAPAGFKLPEGKVHVKGRGIAQAKALIERAEELGIDASEVVTTSVGYLVPEALVERTEKAEEETPTTNQDGDQDPDGQDQNPGDTPDEDLDAYDPSKHTIAEVTEYLEGADDAERERVIAAEKESEKPRKGILDLAETGKESE